MPNVYKCKHMAEYHYGCGFIHKTLNIPQSYPCTPCHSWCSSGSGPIEGFITQLKQNWKRTFVVYIILCVLCMFLLYVWLMDLKESLIYQLKISRDI